MPQPTKNSSESNFAEWHLRLFIDQYDRHTQYSIQCMIGAEVLFQVRAEPDV